MISNVVVTYQVRPEAVPEHIRLIEAVFEQLHTEQPDDVAYRVLCLDDGVSFVHVSTADTPDGIQSVAEAGGVQGVRARLGLPGRHQAQPDRRHHDRPVRADINGQRVSGIAIGRCGRPT